ncbi:hypothetical protein [Rhizobium sp. CC-YZS058]|uniref:hypothetical protein n=1 Tax=Rhizobium sp. CC-YZS058 TaxID=3042153 RepID=UPI002B052D64|nr:hypothetical protein [Rhizobium sp. CC-YZS058]MEA3535315.1 hypothetical protein [Rhizobium sp. CC-YZS058]
MIEFSRLHRRPAALRLWAGAAALALASPAFALDGEDVATKLKAAYHTTGGEIVYQAAETDGDTVLLKDVTLKAPTGSKPESLHVGDVTLSGVEERDDGGYRVETLSLPDVDMKDKGTAFTVEGMEIGGLQIPGNPNGTTLDDLLLYETAGTGPIAITIDGKPFMSIAKSEATLSRKDGDKGFDFTTTISGLSADLSGAKDAKSKDAIEKLGLETINGTVAIDGSWELESGRMAISDYSMDFDKIGKLAFAFDMSGYTMPVVRQMQDAAKAAEANPNKEEANQALGLSMLGLMQQLNFTSAEIRFEDKSITKRLLSYFGAEQGMSGEQFGQSIKGLVPIMMAQLNMPDLQNQVTAAVNAFIDDPKALTIRAEPAKPVPLPMIVGAGMGAPATLPSVLGVTVKAND